LSAQREHLDLAAYNASVQSRPCFICQIVNGTHEIQQPIIYRDEHAIAFMNRYPTVLGYVLVAPVTHLERVVSDFPVEAYLRLQSVIHRVGRAIEAVLPTERLYVLSLGSQQGNSHVHWHLAPLPPDVPYEQQQFHALMTESTGGYLAQSESEQRALAERIAAAIPPA
jgi:diadenosine tetraphosphate (Ap4A) HIT family hydrolase